MLERMAEVGVGAGAGAGVRAQEVRFEKPLLLMSTSKRLPASSLLPRLTGKKFQQELQRRQELKAILTTKLTPKILP